MFSTRRWKAIQHYLGPSLGANARGTIVATESSSARRWWKTWDLPAWILLPLGLWDFWLFKIFQGFYIGQTCIWLRFAWEVLRQSSSAAVAAVKKKRRKKKAHQNQHLNFYFWFCHSKTTRNYSNMFVWSMSWKNNWKWCFWKRTNFCFMLTFFFFFWSFYIMRWKHF